MNETQQNAVLAWLLKSRNKLSRFSPSRDNSRLVGNPYLGITSGLPVIQEEPGNWAATPRSNWHQLLPLGY